MKLFLITALVSLASDGLGQGIFGYSNPRALTRVGSMDGPLAGTNILAQMFAGAVSNSPSAVGTSDFHIDGLVFNGVVAVPGTTPRTFAYAQMVVWDGTIWGGVLADVPAEHIGKTDVARVFLTSGIFPDTVYTPEFMQPAVVPVIPEPSSTVLGIACTVLALFWRVLERSGKH